MRLRVLSPPLTNFLFRECVGLFVADASPFLFLPGHGR